MVVCGWRLPAVALFLLHLLPLAQTNALKRGQSQSLRRVQVEGPFTYVHPPPGGVLVASKTAIIVRAASRVTEDSISGKISATVQGAQVDGRTSLSLDGQTIVFVPFVPFESGAHVVTEVFPGIVSADGDVLSGSAEWEFHVATVDPEGFIVGAKDLSGTLFANPMRQYDDGLIRPIGNDTLTNGVQRYGPLYDNGKAMAIYDGPLSLDPRARYRGYRTIPPTFPKIRVNVAPKEGEVAEGYIFIGTNIAFVGNDALDSQFYAYTLILDSGGDVVWYHQHEPLPQFALVEDRRAKGELMANGEVSLLLDEGDSRRTYTFNNHYQLVKEYSPAAGYAHIPAGYFQVVTNTRDQQSKSDGVVQVNSDGSYLILLTVRHTLDLTGMVEGGKADDIVLDHVVQEFDLSDTLVFEWRSWDHFTHEQLLKWTDVEKAHLNGDWDLMHLNALSWTPDGHLLFSLPSLSGAIKVNRETGDVMWRIFGNEAFNQFTFDPPFYPSISHQHDVRFSGPNTITLFDNGNNNNPTVSRALEFEIDEESRTARLIFSFSDENRFSMCQGSTQRLSNGNIAIGWGGLNLTDPLPFYTEVTRTGEIVLELQMESDANAYRARKHDWAKAIPVWPPAIVLDMNEGEWSDDRPPRLHYSWNGATVVSGWRVYAGVDPDLLELVAEHPREAFEHYLDLGHGSPFYPVGNCVYYQVEPVGVGGQAFMRSALLSSPSCAQEDVS